MAKVVALCLLVVVVSVQGLFFGENDICFVPPESDVGLTIDFGLFTPTNRDVSQDLIADEVDSEASLIKKSKFNPTLPTKFIIHGYTDNGAEGSWVMDMARKMVKLHDVNAIAVDWQGKADNMYYGGAASNTQAVGERIAQLINSLVEITGATYESFHVIGHSLGSHVAGFAGSALGGKIGRVTGLDPAGPCFRFSKPEKRLSPDDAIFVDAIHSDGDNVFQAGFGTELRMADADYYPNGGENQPGCKGWLFQSLMDFFKGFKAGSQSVACSHSRAVKYFDESIEDDQKFLAYPCAHHDKYKECNSCGTVGCSKMGYFASTDKTGVFTMLTNAASPFSMT